MHPACPLSFEDWAGIHEDELQIAASESGADREADYDPERMLEEEYDKYLSKF